VCVSRYCYLLRRLSRRLSGQRGQGLAEYIIIAVLVAIIVIVSVRYFGSSVTNQIEDASSAIANPEERAKAGGKTTSSGASSRSRGTSSTPTSDGGREEISDSSDTSGDSSSGVGPDGGGGDSLAEREARIEELSQGIGDEEGSGLASVQIDWETLLIIAGVICGIGFLVVFRMVSKNKKAGGKGKKGKKGKKANRIRGGQQGQAMVEFVLISITFLFVILGVIQLAMCLNAYSMVRYAAYNAARAAVVHGGDQDMMHEAARVSLLATFPTHGRADHRRGLMENYLGAVATDNNPLLTYFFEPITRVRIVSDQNSTVTFDDPAQASEGLVTVEVRHLYELVIPLVNRIIFRVYEMYRGGGYDGRTLNRLSAETNVARRTGSYQDIEYRIPLVAHYTMRLQSDYEPQ